MISTILAIASGGAIGAVMRYGVNISAVKLWGADFPWATLIVNVAGSFVMGLLIAVFAHLWQPSETLRIFLVTGLLGAFTTFSTFSLDISLLWERGNYWSMTAYTGSSVFLSIAALFAAMALVRGMVS